MSWVYHKWKAGVCSVGYFFITFDGKSEFEAIWDVDTDIEAMRLVNYLNGGAGLPCIKKGELEERSNKALHDLLNAPAVNLGTLKVCDHTNLGAAYGEKDAGGYDSIFRDCLDCGAKLYSGVPGNHGPSYIGPGSGGEE